MERNFENIYEAALRDYASELSHKGMSDRTYQSYTSAIKYFQTYKSENGGWDTAPNLTDMRGWRDSLIDSGTSAKTVCYYLNILKGFFEFATDPELEDQRYFEVNPVLKKIYPIIKKSEEAEKEYSKVLQPEDIKKLWANQQKGTDHLWARNYAIITLLLDGKIRNAELLDLKLSDIHFADAEDPDDCDFLIVRKGKGSKYREVDLNPISVTALKLYLKSGVRPAYLSDDDYLFGTTAEKVFGGNSRGASAEWHRGSGSWLSKLVETHVRKVTGRSGFRTHSMRHNGAIMELNNGVSTEVLQAELGHSSITTTQIYSGRMQSKRNRKNMAEVFAVRDEWAERNQMMLEGV